MKKKMKLLVTFSLAVVLLFGNTLNLFAAPSSSEIQQLSYITEGYTEDGIHYTIYEVITPDEDDNIISPCIVVSKNKTYKIIYEGYITPPDTFYYSMYEEDYHTTMSGTLYLKAYHHDIWPSITGSTHATYEGIIVAYVN